MLRTVAALFVGATAAYHSELTSSLRWEGLVLPLLAGFCFLYVVIRAVMHSIARGGWGDGDGWGGFDGGGDCGGDD